MTSEKKTYNAPKLTIHGNVEEITQNGPQIQQIDVPLGTLVDGKTLNDLTS